MKSFGERGVALMLVVWLIVVIGFVAAAVAASARDQSLVTLNLRTRTVARYAAESGMVAATTQLEELLGSSQQQLLRAQIFRELDSRFAQLKEVELGTARFAVAVADLNARIDLNRSDEATLRNFLSQFIDEREATSIVAALRDWTDRDTLRRADGAESYDYLVAGSPYQPSNGPLRRLDEFRRVLGVTDELAYAIAEHVTVHSDGRININTAPDNVLAALPGIGIEGARLLVEERERDKVFTSSSSVREFLKQRGLALDPLPLPRTISSPSRILIVSRGWEEGHPLTHEIQAVYAFAGQGRLVLQAWEERDL